MRGKALLLADLHLHPLPLWRQEWMRIFLSNILAWQQDKFVGHHLFVLGDAFEVRDKVDARVLNDFLRLVGSWREGDVIWISGQHDSYVPGRATLEGLDSFGVQVVDRDVLHHEATDSWHVPYCRVDDDYRKLLGKAPDGATVFTHLPTIEAIRQFTTKDKQGISVEEFSRFGRVYSGDIHSHSDYENLSYIGAPSQRDWRDKHVDGCYGLLQEGSFKRVFTDHPRHIEVEDESEIPTEGEFIVRAQRGRILSPPKNVLSIEEIIEPELDSIRLREEVQDEREVVGSYLSDNPPSGEMTPDLRERYEQAALDMLEDNDAPEEA